MARSRSDEIPVSSVGRASAVFLIVAAVAIVGLVVWAGFSYLGKGSETSETSDGREPVAPASTMPTCRELRALASVVSAETVPEAPTNATPSCSRAAPKRLSISASSAAMDVASLKLVAATKK